MTILALLLAAVSIISAIFFIGRWSKTLFMLDDVVLCNVKIIKKAIDRWTERHGRYPESFEMLNDSKQREKLRKIKSFTDLTALLQS